MQIKLYFQTQYTQSEKLSSQWISEDLCSQCVVRSSHTSIAEATGSNPIEARIFFQGFLNCKNQKKFTAKVTSHLIDLHPQFLYPPSL